MATGSQSESAKCHVTLSSTCPSHTQNSVKHSYNQCNNSVGYSVRPFFDLFC